MRSLLARTLRAAKLLVTDERIPKPLRWLLVLGLLPVPGPFDEGVVLLLAAILFVFYRDVTRDAWRRAEPG